ncbi:MAG TPA: efflux RND transporter permease subunit [Planctomycetota bacterium]|nr:efflux RND transporter permease subunit [Planctomycetota bacterium]
MNIAATFIRRPVMTSLVMASFLLFGLMAYRQLPVSDLPNVDFPTINVSASLPGASPETMASSVALPLEKQFSTIAGIDSMSSSSSQGRTQISLQFALTRDIDAAAQDVQAAIARSLRSLPAEMPSPPSYNKSNPADFPFLFIALTSPTLPLAKLNEYGETMMAQRISMVSGVAQVQVFGSQKYAVRVQLDPRELASRGIGIDEVAGAVERSNVNMPTGTLWGPERSFTVKATGQLLEAEDYRPVVVTYRNGAPVRLGELGRVYAGVENDKSAAWFCTPEGQNRAIVLAIQRQPGVNTVAVAEAVKELLPSFKAKLPASVSYRVFRDSSEVIKESAFDVQFTMLLTMALVVMSIFIFLRNVSATAIPSAALPMAIVGTFAAMYALDYSLDNLSLMALTLSVGFVVDDAIVMLENIFRHMEMGKPRWQAALDGAQEVGFTIVSMTLSLSAVFIPVLFMGGLIGRLFREFAVTIGVAVLISGFVSLTLTPMLCSRFLKPPAEVQHGRLFIWSEQVFNWCRDLYGRSLYPVLRHRLATLLVSLAILAGTVWLFMVVPKGFVPSEDRDQIMVQTEGPEGVSYISMLEHQQQLAEVVRQDPDVLCFMSSAGPGGPGGGGNNGRMFIALKPRHDRVRSADRIIQELRPKLGAVPGIKAYLQNPVTIPVGGRMSKGQYQYTLLGPDTAELYSGAEKLIARMRGMQELQDVTSDMQLKNSELTVIIDRDQAAALGLSAAQIETALSYAYGSRQVSTIYAANDDYPVIMELLPEYQRGPEALGWLYVRSSAGQLVPLKAVAALKESVGPLSINHTGQLPSVTISFNLQPGVSLGAATAAVQAAAREALPDTLSGSFQGTAQAFQDSLRGMGWLLALAVLVIYVVLGILYESYWHPISILSALPFAGFGALLTLLVFRADLSIYAFVGIIMLVGLVKKNGIMMVDFAVEAERRGRPPLEAIHEACMVRFRPIMMTTMCALMAGLPIALGFGAGAEARRPLGLAVVGGLLFSQSLTLYVTPVFYLYMDSLHRFMGRVFGTGTAAPEAAGPG